MQLGPLLHTIIPPTRILLQASKCRFFALLSHTKINPFSRFTHETLANMFVKTPSVPYKKGLKQLEQNDWI